MEVYQNIEDQNVKPICNICGKQTLTKERLKQHQDAVHKSKGVKCTECDLWVKSWSSLSQHIRIVHDGVKYHCRQCDHKATSQGNLARHKRAVHEGVKYNFAGASCLTQKSSS